MARSCAEKRVNGAQNVRKFTDLARFGATGRKRFKIAQNGANREEIGPAAGVGRRDCSRLGDVSVAIGEEIACFAGPS